METEPTAAIPSPEYSRPASPSDRRRSVTEIAVMGAAWVRESELEALVAIVAQAKRHIDAFYPNGVGHDEIDATARELQQRLERFPWDETDCACDPERPGKPWYAHAPKCPLRGKRDDE